jgi:cyanate lyase
MSPSPSDAIALIREAKEKKSLTWEQIAARVGRSPVYITSACLGENSLSSEDATKLGALLDLGPDIVSLLQSCPKKGSNSQDIPKDPLLYRFHEINLVYGDTLKELIHEKFGDGIDRFHHGGRKSRRSERGPGQSLHVRQVFTL